MSYTFTTPSLGQIARLTVDDLAKPDSPKSSLGRRITQPIRRKNIYRLADGTFVESAADSRITAANPIDRTFWCGTSHTVNAIEAAALEAAGYDVDGFGDGPPDPDTPTGGDGYAAFAYGDRTYGD